MIVTNIIVVRLWNQINKLQMQRLKGNVDGTFVADTLNLLFVSCTFTGIESWMKITYLCSGYGTSWKGLPMQKEFYLCDLSPVDPVYQPT